MSLPVTNYVELLRRVHDDNSTAKHFARGPFGTRSTMFLTAFVYEFFLYNSLYQVDWPASTDSGALAYLASGTEDEKQAAFENFLKSRATADLVRQAFRDLGTRSIEGTWTKIEPDPLITQEEGEAFFDRLRRFRETLRSNDPVILEHAFTRIRELRRFIYKVRCNIFHGRKSLAEAVEENQNKRIELYFQFLNNLVTLFFLVANDARRPTSR